MSTALTDDLFEGISRLAWSVPSGRCYCDMTSTALFLLTEEAAGLEEAVAVVTDPVVVSLVHELWETDFGGPRT